MSAKDIKLGNRVRDVVTCLEGIAVTRCEYLDGTTQFGIQPPVRPDDEKLPVISYIDINRLEKVDDGVQIKAAPRAFGFYAAPEKDHP